MQHSVTPSLDLDALPVPGQLASAVLDQKGTLLKGKLSPHDASILYQMLVTCGSLPLERFRRLTVTFSTSRYVVSRDETHIYVVKTRFP